jgi:putative phosphoesterase
MRGDKDASDRGECERATSGGLAGDRFGQGIGPGRERGGRSFGTRRGRRASGVVRTVKIGLISDTHGLLRPEALRALAGVERIIHAGDIGKPEVIDALRAIAPVDAVRGNNDKDPWATLFPVSLALKFEGVGIHVLHDVKEMDLDPAAAGFQVVIAGHSHKPQITERDGVLFVNPGAAGPRRFTLPVTIGYLTVAAGTVRAQIKALL